MKNFNWSVVGHDKVVKFLQKNIINNKLAHAYLFTGKNNLGKSLLAKQFIDSVLCDDYQQLNKLPSQKLPCRQCVFCQQLDKKIHPDVYFLDKEADKKNITVEQIREMQKILQMASFLNSYKFALINNAEDLSESAQNSLLKVLEEPKKKTILILLTSDASLLLPTIVSRCQTIKFMPLADEKIFDHLISLGANRDKANILASLSNGHIGLAVDYFNNPELFDSYLDRGNSFISMFGQNISNKFKIINNYLSSRKDPQDQISFLNMEFDFWQSFLRDLLLIKENNRHLINNLHFDSQLNQIAQKYPVSRVISFLENIKKTKIYLKNNINPRLAVENLIINL